MTEIDKLLKSNFETEGKNANAFYALFLRSTFFMPVYLTPGEEEPFIPLFTEIKMQPFIFIFDSFERLKAWDDSFDHVELKGIDLIKGISDKVYLSLNPFNDYYKEFSSEEIISLKNKVAKIEELKDKFISGAQNKCGS